jgi:hypothetical protein
MNVEYYNDELVPCRKCGDAPRIVEDWKYERAEDQVAVEIECRKCYERFLSESGGIPGAVEAWNAEHEQPKNPVWGIETDSYGDAVAITLGTKWIVVLADNDLNNDGAMRIVRELEWAQKASRVVDALLVLGLDSEKLFRLICEDMDLVGFDAARARLGFVDKLVAARNGGAK